MTYKEGPFMEYLKTREVASMTTENDDANFIPDLTPEERIRWGMHQEEKGIFVGEPHISNRINHSLVIDKRTLVVLLQRCGHSLSDDIEIVWHEQSATVLWKTAIL